MLEAGRSARLEDQPGLPNEMKHQFGALPCSTSIVKIWVKQPKCWMQRGQSQNGRLCRWHDKYGWSWVRSNHDTPIHFLFSPDDWAFRAIVVAHRPSLIAEYDRKRNELNAYARGWKISLVSEWQQNVDSELHWISSLVLVSKEIRKETKRRQTWLSNNDFGFIVRNTKMGPRTKRNWTTQRHRYDNNIWPIYWRVMASIVHEKSAMRYFKSWRHAHKLFYLLVLTKKLKSVADKLIENYHLPVYVRAKEMFWEEPKTRHFKKNWYRFLSLMTTEFGCNADCDMALSPIILEWTRKRIFWDEPENRIILQDFG